MSQHLHSDFKIRLPDELKEKIRQSAKELNRSMTADIVARLEDSFEPSLPPSFGLEQMEVLTKMAGASYMLILQDRIDKLNDDEALQAVRSLINEASEEYKHVMDNIGGLRGKQSNQ